MTSITLEDGTTAELPSPQALSGSNCGTPGVWRFDAAAPGPRVVITALIHGNEVCGATALGPLLANPPRPAAGGLTLVFCNLRAYEKLVDANKADCRFVDEDLNRVWGRLDASAAETDTCELRRAREILPFLEEADVLLDLHSMTQPAPALGLVGTAEKNVDFARQLGFPVLLVQDAGHASGLRLIDRPRFSHASFGARAMLLECGQHFSREAMDAAAEAVRRMLAVFIEGGQAEAGQQTLIEVTEAVTIATDRFEFVRDWPNMGLVTQAGTLIARDGDTEVRAPHDGTYLVMPATARHRKSGLTAVRFGRVKEVLGA